MSNQNPTVYVVDDDKGSRESLRALVCSIGVSAETFATAEDFLAALNPDRPGCLVTDLRMLGMSGIELQRELLERGIGLPVILLTAHAETPLTVKAVKQGAVTVLEKPCRDYELYDAIRDALALDSSTRQHVAKQNEFVQRLELLSPDERIVLELMVEGIANKEIARQLDVSIRTIENRRQKIFEKTGTETLAELIRRFVEFTPKTRE